MSAKAVTLSCKSIINVGNFKIFLLHLFEKLYTYVIVCIFYPQEQLGLLWCLYFMGKIDQFSNNVCNNSKILNFVANNIRTYLWFIVVKNVDVTDEIRQKKLLMHLHIFDRPDPVPKVLEIWTVSTCNIQDHTWKIPRQTRRKQLA